MFWRTIPVGRSEVELEVCCLRLVRFPAGALVSDGKLSFLGSDPASEPVGDTDTAVKSLAALPFWPAIEASLPKDPVEFLCCRGPFCDDEVPGFLKKPPARFEFFAKLGGFAAVPGGCELDAGEVSVEPLLAVTTGGTTVPVTAVALVVLLFRHSWFDEPTLLALLGRRAWSVGDDVLDSARAF